MGVVCTIIAMHTGNYREGTLIGISPDTRVFSPLEIDTIFDHLYINGYNTSEELYAVLEEKANFKRAKVWKVAEPNDWVVNKPASYLESALAWRDYDGTWYLEVNPPKKIYTLRNMPSNYKMILKNKNNDITKEQVETFLDDYLEHLYAEDTANKDFPINIVQG